MRILTLVLLWLAFMPAQPERDHMMPDPGDAATAQQEETLLIVTIENIMTTEGVLRLGFYTPTDDFPDVPHRNPVFSKELMKDDTVTDTIRNITPGTYALTLLDDLNKNGKMDYTILGMPREGFGFSNNARPRLLKSPDFESCSFNVEQGMNRVTFRVQYF